MTTLIEIVRVVVFLMTFKHSSTPNIRSTYYFVATTKRLSDRVFCCRLSVPLSFLLFIHPLFTHLFHRRPSHLQVCPAARVRQELSPRMSAHSSCLSLSVRVLNLYLLPNNLLPAGLVCAQSFSPSQSSLLLSFYQPFSL